MHASFGKLTTIALLLAGLPGGRLPAQYPPDPDARGTISGVVMDAARNSPMPRVQVVLQPVSGDAGPAAATTLKDGRFQFRDLPSAYYSLLARHAGYLPGSFAETEHTRLPYVFGLMPGEQLEDIVIRLRPAGVVSGRVEFTDGAPAIGVAVQFYREYFFRGRHGFQPAGSAPTDDRGRYRIYGLAPGRYYIVAAYSPPVPAEGVREERQRNPDGTLVPDEDFVPTFYPSTHRLIEAMPVQVRASEELNNTDILLARARSARIRGRVVSGETGDVIAGADIELWRPSPVTNIMLVAPATVRQHEGGGFEIIGVTPEAYTLIVKATENGVDLTGRIPITVSGSDVENVGITVTPYRQLTGTVVHEGDQEVQFPLSLFRVAIDPHSDLAPSVSAGVDDDGHFSLSYVPGETYDVFLQNGPAETYLKSARIGNFDVIRTGFRGEAGPLPSMELEFSERGAVIQGEIAQSSTRVALGATVVLVPDPAFGRVQYYQMTSTDAYGLYQFYGVAPGRYTLVSWWDEPPCEVYDLDRLDACRKVGTPVEIDEGETKMVNFSLSDLP